MADFRKYIEKFVSSTLEYPVLFAVAAGLYTFFYVYHSNFMLVNSAFQFLIIFSLYIALPVVVFAISWMLVNRVNVLKKLQPYIFPALNAAFFSYFIVSRIYHFGYRKRTLLIVVGCVLLAILLRKHYKKIVVLQLVMALVAFVTLVPTLYKAVIASDAWQEQPDAIIETQFTSFPNIYVIQPDGYVNFRELAKDPYNFDNKDFETFLAESGFKLYDNYRSNYTSTILSNSSMFAMKHHYHGEQLFGARAVIAGKNPVIETLKNNQYETFLMLDHPYILSNHPTIRYDHCNISMDEVPWFGMGIFDLKKEVIQPLEETIKKQQGKRSFYFIEKILPGHISTFKEKTLGKEIERKNYLTQVEIANAWLREIISVITTNDPNGLIIIAADHGGYVGLNYTKELFQKQTDKKLIYSAFSAALAIKWPKNNASEYDSELKTSVNLFRTLFAYLGENKALLEHLQEDASFSMIKNGFFGDVYKYIDDDGTVVFEKVEK